MALMKKTLLILALLTAVLAPSHAEVLVYKGKATELASPGSFLPSSYEAFFVVNIVTKQAGRILFFEANGQKRQLVNGAATYDFTSAPKAGGGTVRLIAESTTGGTQPNFFHNFFFFRGIQKSIIVSGSGTTRTEPRVLKGVDAGVERSDGTSNFSDARFTLVYQQAQTVKANDANRTLNQTLQDLSAKLAAKGFTPIDPP